MPLSCVCLILSNEGQGIMCLHFYSISEDKMEKKGKHITSVFM